MTTANESINKAASKMETNGLKMPLSPDNNSENNESSNTFALPYDRNWQNKIDNSAEKKSIEDAVLDISSFRKIDIPERKAFLSPWLKEDSITMIYGWRGCGKTFFALGILYHISRGIPFGPWNCELSGTCLFLDGEMTMSDDKERLEAMGFYDDQEKNPLLIYSDHYASRLGMPRANLVNEEWRSEFKKFLIDKKVKLLVIDNIASLSPGLDENVKKDWDPINQWLLDLRFNKISTILLHHESKGGNQRGTAAREDNLDVSIRLKRPRNYKPENGCHFVACFEKARVPARYSKLMCDFIGIFSWFQSCGEDHHINWNSSLHSNECVFGLDD